MGINELPDLHKDPFDRLIIALAVAEKLTLITEDHKFKDYPVMLYGKHDWTVLRSFFIDGFPLSRRG